MKHNFAIEENHFAMRNNGLLIDQEVIKVRMLNHLKNWKRKKVKKVIKKLNPQLKNEKNDKK